MSTKIENNFQGDNNKVTNVVITKPRSRKSQTAYPPGCIGADLVQRNYIHYLVQRYQKFKEADPSYGKPTGFSYAVIYKNIETKFKTPTYFVPTTRFQELADYLQSRIDQTILGKRNRSRQQASYSTFDEFQFEQNAANESA